MGTDNDHYHKIDMDLFPLITFESGPVELLKNPHLKSEPSPTGMAVLEDCYRTACPEQDHGKCYNTLLCPKRELTKPTQNLHKNLNQNLSLKSQCLIK